MIARKKGLPPSEKAPLCRSSGLSISDSETYFKVLGHTSRKLRAWKDGSGTTVELGEVVNEGWSVGYPINGWDRQKLNILVHEDDGPSDLETKKLVWQQIGLEPTMQVFSGNKSIHNYWVLNEPVSPEKWSELQKRLAKTLGGDTSLSDLGQIMRVPGYLHPKTGKLAEIINVTNLTYTATDFDVRLGKLTVKKVKKTKQKVNLDPVVLSALKHLANSWGPYEQGQGSYPARLRIAAVMASINGGLEAWSETFGHEETLGRKSISDLFDSVKEPTDTPVTVGTLFWEAKEQGWVHPIDQVNDPLQVKSMVRGATKKALAEAADRTGLDLEDLKTEATKLRIAEASPDDALSICKTSKNGDIKLPVDSVMGKFLGQKWKDRYRWDTEAEAIKEWDGSKWVQSDNALRDMLHEELDHLCAPVSYLRQVRSYLTDYYPHVIRKTAVGTYFNNGRLIDGRLEDHSPDNCNQSVLGFDYDPTAKCPKILEWINWAQDGEIGRKKLIALLACAAKGRPPQAQIFGEITGIAQSGKSTFSLLAQVLAGFENSVATDPHTLERERFGLYPVVGKRLVLLQDIGKYGGELNRLKALTGGDTLSAEVKHQKAPVNFSFDGLILAVGEKTLKSSDYQAGLARRRVQLHFKKQVEKPRHLLSISNGQISGEFAEELPGLWNLVTSLTDQEITEALNTTVDESDKEEQLQQLAEQNPIAGFALEILEPGTESLEMGDNDSPTGLYNDYKTYCNRMAILPVSVTRFSRDLKDVLTGVLKWQVTKGLNSKGRSVFRGLQRQKN